MNFALSDDQQMLQDGIARLLADRYQLDQRLAAQHEPQGYSAEIWQAFVDMGLTMLPFPEKQGGLGLGSVEMMLVGEAFGRALVIEPYLSSIVLAGTALSTAADAASDVLAGVMAGDVIAGFAPAADIVECDGQLSGRANMVLGGDCASFFVLPVGQGALCLPADTHGISIRRYRLHGGGGAAELMLDQVAANSAIRLGADATVRGTEAGLAFLAAEAAGAMQAALDVTLDYLKTRQQFGRTIGTYQVLQHRAAEMAVEVEQAQSAAIYAALLMQEPNAPDRTRGLAAVKAVIGKAGRFVAQSAVQLHGGIGVSEEHVISHYFRRLTAIGMLLGDTQSHIGNLARLGGFTAAELEPI
jgi:alkylation response protein AidB-like acyl-CoA dehydrogenase